MGQKSNPNSFNINKNKSIIFHNSSAKPTEYSKTFLISYSFSQVFNRLLEKRGGFIKNFYFVLDSKRNSLIIYMSVFFSNNNFSKNSQNLTNLSKTTLTLQKQIFKIFNLYGLKYKKRFIFQNLNKTFDKVSLNINQFKRFKNESFFESSLSLMKILLSSNNNSGLLAKFISKFFKLLHKTKKLNKFFLFLGFLLKFLVKNSLLIKGVKIQIKGRLRGSSRSKTRLIQYGIVPLQTIDSTVSYTLTHTHTVYGTFGIRVWIISNN